MRSIPGNGIKCYNVSFVYNVVQVMLCSYMCIEAFARLDSALLFF